MNFVMMACAMFYRRDKLQPKRRRRQKTSKKGTHDA